MIRYSYSILDAWYAHSRSKEWVTPNEAYDLKEIPLKMMLCNTVEAELIAQLSDSKLFHHSLFNCMFFLYFCLFVFNYLDWWDLCQLCYAPHAQEIGGRGQEL